MHTRRPLLPSSLPHLRRRLVLGSPATSTAFLHLGGLLRCWLRCWLRRRWSRRRSVLALLLLVLVLGFFFRFFSVELGCVNTPVLLISIEIDQAGPPCVCMSSLLPPHDTRALSTHDSNVGWVLAGGCHSVAPSDSEIRYMYTT